MSALPERTKANAELPDISDGRETPPHAPRSIEDVPVKIAAVLGKTKIDVAQLKALGDGAVIELNRKVGEPIDLYVNDRLIARGELVLTDGVLGVTMTEIVRDDD
ncbi:MAG: flagellar motor switch protein FliN [Pseudomonadota bacterium]